MKLKLLLRALRVLDVNTLAIAPREKFIHAGFVER